MVAFRATSKRNELIFGNRCHLFHSSVCVDPVGTVVALYSFVMN